MNIHFLQSDHGHFLIKKASYGHNLISLTYILGIYSRRHNSLGSFVCNPGFNWGTPKPQFFFLSARFGQVSIIYQNEELISIPCVCFWGDLDLTQFSLHNYIR